MEGTPIKRIPDNHWFKAYEKILKETGENPDPLQLRAEAIIQGLGLPQGQFSALGANPEGKRTDLHQDKIIAQYLTNRAGVMISKNPQIISRDFRDYYPKGLPEELREALAPSTLAYMDEEYHHAAAAAKNYELAHGEDVEADNTIQYFRMPGGTDLFLRGYTHDEDWHHAHESWLAGANRFASVLCIEGRSGVPYGKKLDAWWNPEVEYGHYDSLMDSAVKSGFDGYFAEVDARDNSKISMDNDLARPLDTSSQFYDAYFAYLTREHPMLAEKLISPKSLKEVLRVQSTSEDGVRSLRKEAYHGGKTYWEQMYPDADSTLSDNPTFLLLGQHLFSDALATIKLHLISKLMADGYIPKGPIVDYEGAAHIANKAFFIQYPQYAMEIVLRSIHELMAGTVTEEGDMKTIHSIFENPDWTRVVQEITRLTVKKPGSDDVLTDVPFDYLHTYKIDPSKIVPTDADIDTIRNSIQ